MISQALMPLAPALAFYSTRAQAITKALLTDRYYSVMLLSGAGGRGGGEAGHRRGQEGKRKEGRSNIWCDIVPYTLIFNKAW